MSRVTNIAVRSIVCVRKRSSCDGMACVGAKMARKLLSAHCAMECLNTRVLCPNSQLDESDEIDDSEVADVADDMGGCEWTGERGSLQSHLSNDCQFTTVMCKHCRANSILRKDLPIHHQTCPEIPVPCEQGCGMRLFSRPLLNAIP